MKRIEDTKLSGKNKRIKDSFYIKLSFIVHKNHTNIDISILVWFYVCGEPGGIRTPDPRLRRPVLYPTELLTHKSNDNKYNSTFF